MPVFTKLSEEEVKALKEKKPKSSGPSQRQIVREQYVGYLSRFGPGDVVSVTLEDGESRLTTKNRLTKAASELNYQLKFYRTRGTVKFEIEPKAEERPKATKRTRKS